MTDDVKDIAGQSEGPASLPVPYPGPVFAATEQRLVVGTLKRPSPARRLSLRVANVGGAGTLKVTLTPTVTANWFTVSPQSLSLPAGEEASVTVEINPSATDCPVGSTDGVAILVSAPESALPCPDRIPVQVEFVPVPLLVVTPAALDFGSLPMGESRQLTVTLQRTDEAEFALAPHPLQVVDTFGAPHPAWVSLRIPPGKARKHEVEVTFHTANRAPGEYACRVHLGEQTGETQVAEIAVRAVVTDPPALEWKWEAEPLIAYARVVQPLRLRLSNTGTGILQGKIAGGAPWIEPAEREFALKAGEATSVLVQVGGVLMPGEHAGSVEISANHRGRARTVHVPVRLVVESDSISPLTVEWNGAFGEVKRGRKVTRQLSIRNRTARPFEGEVTTDAAGWIRFRNPRVHVGPGEAAQVRVQAVTRGIAVGKEPAEQAAVVRIEEGGRVRWQGEAAVRVRKGFPVLRCALGILILWLAIQTILALPPVQPPIAPDPGARSGTGNSAEAHALYAQGQAAMQRHDYPKAARLFEQAAKSDPEPAGSYLAWGKALYYMESYDEALHAFERATALKPLSRECREWLARAQARVPARP